MRGIQLPFLSLFWGEKLSDGKWMFYCNKRKTNRLPDEIPLFIFLVFTHSAPNLFRASLSLTHARAHTHKDTQTQPYAWLIVQRHCVEL